MTQMNYKTFEGLMKRLLAIKKDEINLNKSLKKFDPDFNYLSFSRYEDLVIDSIKEAMVDKCDWIGYWLYELNEGKDAKKDSIKIDGKSVSCKTIKDLYNLIKNDKSI